MSFPLSFSFLFSSYDHAVVWVCVMNAKKYDKLMRMTTQRIPDESALYDPAGVIEREVRFNRAYAGGVSHFSPPKNRLAVDYGGL